MKIKRYMIVTGRNLDNLEMKVSDLLKNNWVPQGGVHTAGPLYAQAVVLPDYDLSDPGPL